MRLGFLLIALAACSSSASAGPAWPKSTARDTDGGESLSPRAAARTVAVKLDDDDDKPAVPAVTGERPVVPATAPGVGGSADRPAASTAAASDEPVTTEDIVIEIED